MRLSWIVIAALAYQLGVFTASAPAQVVVTPVVLPAPRPVVVVDRPVPVQVFSRPCRAWALNSVPPGCYYTNAGCPC
jgi:hypothetical protein